MKQERIRKLSFLMALVMIVGLLLPLGGSVVEANAAKKKAAFGDEFCSDIWYDPNEFYTDYWVLPMQNLNPKAVYTIEISDKSVAEYTGVYESGFVVRCKKLGSFKVTVKEKYNGKVRKIGTKTCTIKPAQGSIGTYYGEKFTMEAGTAVLLRGLVSFSGDIRVSSTNSSVAGIEEVNGRKIVVAKKSGTAKLRVELADHTGEKADITITVKAQDNSSLARQKRAFAERINKCGDTTITKQNALQTLKEINVILKTWERQYFGEIVDHEGTVQLPIKYDHNDLHKIMRDCRNALGLQLAESYYGVSPEVVKISKLTKNSLTMQLDHAVTEAEMEALKWSDNYYLGLVDENGNIVCNYKCKIKKGSKTITGKLTDSFVPMKKGKTYYIWLGDKKNHCIKTIRKVYK